MFLVTNENMGLCLYILQYFSVDGATLEEDSFEQPLASSQSLLSFLFESPAFPVSLSKSLFNQCRLCKRKRSPYISCRRGSNARFLIHNLRRKTKNWRLRPLGHRWPTLRLFYCYYICRIGHVLFYNFNFFVESLNFSMSFLCCRTLHNS